MSRSGYSEDVEDRWAFIRWRGVVASAIRGKRGQAFLREMLATLDALPKKRLIAEELRTPDGDVCAIGSVGAARGVDLGALDPHDYDAIAKAFGIAAPLVREIEAVNDECGGGYAYEALDANARALIYAERRFKRVREWVASQIKPPAC